MIVWIFYVELFVKAYCIKGFGLWIKFQSGVDKDFLSKIN